MAEIQDKKLLIDGYIYVRSRSANGRIYWDCRNVRKRECSARAITNEPKPGEEVVIFKGPQDSVHTHAPNREETKAVVVTQDLKRKATEHPGQPPSQILRNELPSVSTAVLSQMPEREALNKAMRRARRKNLPPNPRSLGEMGAVPERFQRTLLGERFLIYDSREEDLDEAESEAEGEDGDTERVPERVLVFGTSRNVELLCQSRTWYVDGTFKTSPRLFLQVFTIMGLRQRNVVDGESVALPFVYALLSRKTEAQYTQVLQTVKDIVLQYNVPGPCLPARIMSDFEKAIMNACNSVFPESQMTCCFFHLGQSLYRRIQSEGLQRQYNDPEDRSIKENTHCLLALAFVPVADVPRTFGMLKREWAAQTTFKPILTYFDKTYVNGVPARGRRPAVLPRYTPRTWNHYEAALNKHHRTNNVSEAWHRRFEVVVGKHHPDVYSALLELQKEQADTESMVAELSLGRKVRAQPQKKWVASQLRIQTIAEKYEEHKANNTVLDYLRSLSYSINV